MESTQAELFGKTSMEPFLQTGEKILESSLKKSPTLQGGGGNFNSSTSVKRRKRCLEICRSRCGRRLVVGLEKIGR